MSLLLSSLCSSLRVPDIQQHLTLLFPSCQLAVWRYFSATSSFSSSFWPTLLCHVLVYLKAHQQPAVFYQPNKCLKWNRDQKFSENNAFFPVFLVRFCSAQLRWSSLFFKFLQKQMRIFSIYWHNWKFKTKIFISVNHFPPCRLHLLTFTFDSELLRYHPFIFCHIVISMKNTHLCTFHFRNSHY